MNRIKLHVRKGDNVEVISGNFKGSSGKVLEVIARKQRVLIEGVRMIKKHLKKSQDNPQGKIAEREGPIHISNVRVLERGERAAGKGKESKKKTTKEKPAKSKASKNKEAKEE
ncbi:MAG TPA: 50S ribosomal protein L24 [Chthoniobacterales bacterium]|nr:50S ribosomal protein L24 [Chthoniobacterales bacterium]